MSRVSLLLCLWLMCHSYRVSNVYSMTLSEYNDMSEMFEKYNRQLIYFKRMEAITAWNISTDPKPETMDENERCAVEFNIWNNQWCADFIKLYNARDKHNNKYSKHWTEFQFRQVYLICRGPRFTSYQLRNILSILSTMQNLYNDEVCIDELQCLRMEPGLNHIMESSRDEKMLKKTWMAWHNTIGPEVKPLYVNLVRMLNQGARQAGHEDIGECWREETEIENLREVAMKLYMDVRYLYLLLHSYVRFKIQQFYNLDLDNGPIPAHLLGNMWAQKWDSLIDIVWPETDIEHFVDTNPLVHSLIPENGTLTVADMVKEAENFYVSMGFPKLPRTFWENSFFEDEKAQRGKWTMDRNKTEGYDGNKRSKRNCHGSAVNMFGASEPEYRIMMCAEVNDADLITIHHELGHIMYFMAYRSLPTVFQDGANSAFHESVGDAITYALGNKKKFSMKKLFKEGLAKLPQIGFGLVMDLWRWEVFKNEDSVGTWNQVWWDLNHEYMGIEKPSGYDEDNEHSDRFDAAGKFHIIDNMPYIRYFIGSFLQMQFYEAMCNEAGWTDLHKCQLRGSKVAGDLLWKMMEQGSSRNWHFVLEEMTGSTEVLSNSLLKYFHPLKIWLQEEVYKNNLTLGWSSMK